MPKAILLISAHWMTDGTYVSASAKPETIYDFFGFPDELYNITYPAKVLLKQQKKFIFIN